MTSRLALLGTAALLGVLAMPPAAGAAEPVVAVELPAGELAVGDHAPVTLVVDIGDAVLDAAPRFPAWRDSWGSAEVVEADEPVRSEAGGRVIFRQRVVLQAFRPGEVALPPVEVAVPLAGGTRTITTPADLALSIGSVLPPSGADGDDEAIPPPQPPAPPRTLPLGAAFWVTAAIGGALLLALLLPMLRRRHAAAGRRPALEPLPELTAGLTAARAADTAEEGHALVSRALRRYLGRRLSFHAAQSTTSEVQRQLLARHLPAGLPKRAVELLRACDLVKFARRPAARAEVERWADEALRMAGEIEVHLAPPEAAEPREAAA